jgi:retron-type reverse transcriptase
MEKLQNLVELLKSGTYRAPPVKRVYIPKAGSRTEKPPPRKRVLDRDTNV